MMQSPFQGSASIFALPSKLIRSLRFVALVSILVGCGSSVDGPATYRVEGTVQFRDGAPVRTGKVEFLSEDGRWSATGSIDAEGHFVMGTHKESDGAVAGTHQVIVTQFFIPDHPTMSLEVAGPPVAEAYTSFYSTPLTVEIEPVSRNRITISVDPADEQ